jgi:hypothetical protein
MRREHLVDGRPVGGQLAEVVRVGSRGGSRLERGRAGREGSSGEEGSEEAPACLQAVELREKRLYELCYRVEKERSEDKNAGTRHPFPPIPAPTLTPKEK